VTKLKKNIADAVDLRDVIDDPREAFEHSGGQPVLIQVPLEQVRNLGPLAFSVTRASGEPFVATVQAYLRGEQKTYRGSWLEWFYKRWTPANAADLLGLPEGSTLAASPIHAFVYPWRSDDPIRRQARKLKSMRQENRQKGADISGEEGYVWAGPMSRRKGEFEFARLSLLTDIIKRYGFETDDPNADPDRNDIRAHIKGKLMIRGTEWRILGTHGNHRRSVLAALGWSHAPMAINNKPIRREHSASWPNVRKGLFTVAQALEIFDRIFEGRQPASCPSIRAAKDIRA